METDTRTVVYTGSFQPQFRTSLMMDMDVDGKGDGIYIYTLDEESGELQLDQNVYGIINPAKLCMHGADRLYAASDTNEFINWAAGTGGGVYAFDAGNSGTMREVDRRSSCGVRAIDLCCDQSGQYLLAINEGTDFCTTEFIKNDQGKYTANVRRDEGCIVLFRVNERRFERVCDRYVLPDEVPAHPHSIKIDNDNYVYITNRGAEAIHVLKLDADTETVAPVTVIKEAGVSGLWGLELHPSLPIFYCTWAESGEILSYRFDKSVSNIIKVQSVMEEEKSNPGPITINHDGSTVYTADSSQGEIKVYSVSQEGKLVLFQRIEIDPSGPIGFIYDMAITPSGKWLLLSDMKNDSILSFRITDDGGLDVDAVETEAKTPTGILIHNV